MRVNRIPVRCLTCGETFAVHPYRRLTAKFCSLVCLGKSPKPNRQKTDSCWLWTGSKDTAGYGHLRIDDRLVLAHRFSFELHHGALSEGRCVLHNCPRGDNPACVNPAHLWAGTKGDNNSDRKAKGRSKPERGEAHYRTTLTDDEVRQIRSRYAAGGVTHRDLAAQYGVTRRVIGCLIRCETWKHV